MMRLLWKLPGHNLSVGCVCLHTCLHCTLYVYVYVCMFAVVCVCMFAVVCMCVEGDQSFETSGGNSSTHSGL